MLLLRRSAFGRSASVVSGVLCAAVFALAAARTRWPGEAWWPVAAAAVLGLGLGWLGYRLFEGPLGNPGARFHGWIAFHSARREGLLLPQRLELADEGLRVTSAKGETLTRWSGVREVVRTEGHVFFFVTRRVAFLAPRRAFGSDEAFQAFGSEAEARHSGAAGTGGGVTPRGTGRSPAA